MAVESLELAGIYDIVGLLDFCMGDVEFAEELLDRFHARLGSVADSLEASVYQGDFETAARTVHSLKGEAGTVSARRLCETAVRLEHALRSSEISATLELVGQLRAAVDQCLNAHLTVRDALQSGG